MSAITKHQKTIRAFIAFNIPNDVKKAIITVRNKLKISGLGDIRWTRPEGLHLTLKFLGDIKSDDIMSIRKVMTSAAKFQAPITVAARGAGVFPNMKRPRVIWIGIAGQTKALAAFRNTLEAGLNEIGFPRENRMFNAHLTLGRIKGPVDRHRFREALAALQPFESRLFSLEDVILFQSRLQSGGALYTKLHTIPFSQKSAGMLDDLRQ